LNIFHLKYCCAFIDCYENFISTRACFHTIFKWVSRHSFTACSWHTYRGLYTWYPPARIRHSPPSPLPRGDGWRNMCPCSRSCFVSISSIKNIPQHANKDMTIHHTAVELAIRHYWCRVTHLIYLAEVNTPSGINANSSHQLTH